MRQKTPRFCHLTKPGRKAQPYFSARARNRAGRARMSAALLSFARMLLEQADIMQEHFGVGPKRVPKFCVSCQHYSFAVNAFVEVVKEYDADRYGFILRETQTGSASRSMN